MAKLSFKKKILPSVMALASGMTFVGNANAIHLADDGLGQTLLAPLYLAQFGYSTKVAIVNTRDDVAVKARVAIRSAVECKEMLDFICYLTPGDVCRFEIRPRDTDGDGTIDEVVMYSDDDSIKSPVPEGENRPLVDSLEISRSTFASIRSVEQTIYTYKLAPGDTNKMGHIEVVGVYGVKGTVTGYIPNRGGAPKPVSVTVKRGMAKFALAQIFDTPRSKEYYEPGWYWHTENPIELDKANPPTEAEERKAGAQEPYSPLTTSRIRSTDPTWIQLKGDVELISGVDRIGYRMPALAGSLGDNVPYPYTTPSGLPATVAVWDGLVVSNPTFDANHANEVGLGGGFGVRDNGIPGDKVVEIEAALAATNLVGRFEDTKYITPLSADIGKRTRMLVTFPTRYLHEGVDVCGAGGTGNIFYPPFQSNGNVSCQLIGYNNFEQVPGTVIIPPVITGTPFSGGQTIVIEDPPEDEPTSCGNWNEVNYFIPNWPATELTDAGYVKPGTKDFRSGWFSMNFTAVPGCHDYYPGVPVLSFTHKYVETKDGDFTQSWFMPTAHKPVRECHDNEATDGCPSMYW